MNKPIQGYSKNVEIRWSDLDPNFHLRHSVYYDWGAFVRISFMSDNGITPAVLQAAHIGPILFREECIFKKEVHFRDEMEVTLQIHKSTPGYTRWSMVHEIWKNKEILSAIINIDAAWIDTATRKLVAPPASFVDIFDKIPKAEHFEWINR